MTGSTLGLDVGGTGIKWVLLTDGGDRNEGSLATPQDGPDSVVRALAAVVDAQAGRVRAIGVAVPGHVDTVTGTTILVPNLPGDWDGYPIVARLAAALGGRQVSLINDARAFGLAELTLGAAAGRDRAVFAVLGTGLGGAVAIDGRVLRNDTDSVGEFGHSTVVRDGERCGCGNNGCAEAYAGVRALSQRYRATGAVPDGQDRRTVLDRLRADYDAGDPRARGVLDDAAWATGCAVTNLCVALRISTVVLGGGLGIHWPEFAAETTRQLARREVLIGRPVVSISALGDRAGAIGAALLARQHLSRPELFEASQNPVMEKELTR